MCHWRLVRQCRSPLSTPAGYDPPVRTLRRLILTSLTLLSLLLFIATTALWLRSHFRYDWLLITHGLRATPDRCPEYGTIPAQVSLARSLSKDVFTPPHRHGSHKRRTSRR